MTKYLLPWIAGSMALASPALMAEETPLPADSVYTLDAIEVTASSALRTTWTSRQPVSSSVLSPVQMRRYDATDLTTLTGRTPSLYIPDYGSKRSTAVYLRGVGSRNSGQTIGFYVDGIPYLSKLAFNFDLLGIKQIEVLRGPQGTLYGRNAMAGAINLYTLSAFDGERGEVRLRAGDYDTYSASAILHHRLSKHWGVSLGARAGRRDGYHRNITTGSRQDSLRTLGAFAKLEYRPSERFEASLSAHFDDVAQGAFPYQPIDPNGQILPLQSGDAGRYERQSVQVGLNLRWRGRLMTLASATGYQHLDDQMSMDMDGMAQKMFFATQSYRQEAITQEVVLRNTNASDRYQWSIGAFGFYDANKPDANVYIQPVGLQGIQGNLARALGRISPQAAGALILNTSREVLSPNAFDKPEWGLALYHESTLRDVLTPGLSITAGLRLDYSHQAMSYDSRLALPVRLPSTPAGSWVERPSHLMGQATTHTLQLLPKVAVQYEHDNWALYATITKGFKSGGFNEQTLNDIIQRAQVADLMSLAGFGAPYDGSKLSSQLAYKPETAWSYEVGGRLSNVGILRHLSAAAYYMDVHDLQLTSFVSSGAGRVITNAGSSRSLGAELSARFSLTRALSLNASYGYTHATFGKRSQEELQSGVTDVEGRFVPFIPRHTYSVMLSAHETTRGGVVTDYFADLEVQGLGTTYWTETNNTSQGGHLTLGGRMGVGLGRLTLTLWGKNLFNSRHEVFHFRFMRDFAQLATPRTFGIDLSYRL